MTVTAASPRRPQRPGRDAGPPARPLDDPRLGQALDRAAAGIAEGLP